MGKFSYKEIKEIKKYTLNELKGKELREVSKKVYNVGYYMPSQANWSYQVYVIEYQGRLIQVVTVFGKIEEGA